jgi:hypothetical protein
MPKPETYPRDEDIQLHKDKVFQMLLLCFKGKTMDKNSKYPLGFSEKDVETALRSLAGDAALWVYNNCEPKLDIEEAKKFISSLVVKVE